MIYVSYRNAMPKHYKPPADLMTVVIPVRLTEQQHRDVKKAAKASRSAVSSWIREAAVAACSKVNK